jgi:hypothetical protein
MQDTANTLVTMKSTLDQFPTAIVLLDLRERVVYMNESARRILRDVGYQGTLTRRLPVSLSLNFIPLAGQDSFPVDQRSAYFTAAVPNPMARPAP